MQNAATHGYASLLEMGLDGAAFANEERIVMAHEAIDSLEPRMEETANALVEVATSARVHPTAVLGDYVCIGENVVVGPHCYLRSYVVLMPGVKLGFGVELDRVVLHADVKIAHHACVGRSIVGPRCNLGFGCVVATRRLSGKPVFFGTPRGTTAPRRVSPRTHHGAVIGADVYAGVNVSLMPGSTVAPGLLLGPNREYRGFVAEP